MPWPNLIMAEKNNEISAKASWCYSMQLVYRNKLNIIHRDLYGPGKENGTVQSFHMQPGD